jgi:hypothetical protein
VLDAPACGTATRALRTWPVFASISSSILSGSEPLGDDHEQRPAVLATEHARVARAVELDAVEDLAALTDAQDGALPARAYRAAPDGTLGVDTDPVTRDVGPDAPVREATVLGDVEGREPGRE